MAFTYFIIIKVTSLFALIDLNKSFKDFISEVFTLHILLGNIESITEFIFNIIRLLNSIFNLVQSSWFNSHSNGLIELLISKTSIKHLIDDCFHLRLNLYLFIRFLIIMQSPLNVLINTFVNQSLHILTSFIQIKLRSCLQCQSQWLFIFFQVIKHLWCNRSSQVSVWKCFIFSECFTIIKFG